jgi:hypothetical protein
MILRISPPSGEIEPKRMSAVSFARARRVERNRPTRCRRSSTARGSSSTYALQVTFRQPTRRRRFSLIPVRRNSIREDQVRSMSYVFSISCRPISRSWAEPATSSAYQSGLVRCLHREMPHRSRQVRYLRDLPPRPSTPVPLVVADVTYQYIPGFSFQIWNWKVSKTFNMAQTQYMRPRGSSSLTYAATTGAKCPQARLAGS